MTQKLTRPFTSWQHVWIFPLMIPYIFKFGSVIIPKTQNAPKSYTFAMLSCSFQSQKRLLTFSWTQCSSLTPSLTVGGSCKHSSLSASTPPKPFIYTYFLLCCRFRLNRVMGVPIVFSLTKWRYEVKSRASAKTCLTTFCSMGSHEANVTHAWDCVCDSRTRN